MTGHVVLGQVIQVLKTKGYVSVMGGVSSKSKPNKDDNICSREAIMEWTNGVKGRCLVVIKKE